MLRPIKKRWLIAVAVLGLSGLAAFLVARRTPDRLVYQGKSVKSWALQFYAPNPALRDEAADTFKSLGSNAVPALVELLRTRDSVFRRQTRALAAKLPARFRPFLLRMLRGPDAAMVRAAAARALGMIGPEARTAVPALARVLRTDEPQVRWHAAGALSHIGGYALVELAAALANPDPNVRYAAACALGNAGPEAIVAAPALLKASDDPEASVRVPASASLVKLGPTVIPFLTNAIVQGDAPTRQRAAHALASLRSPGEQIVPPLVRLLHDPEPSCRIAAIQSLATFQFPNQTIVDAFIELIQDPDPAVEVKLGAVRALSRARWHAAPAVAALIVCLSDESPAIRECAAQALAAMGPPAKSALPDLARLANDQQERVRTAAEHAVARVKGEPKGQTNN